VPVICDAYISESFAAETLRIEFNNLATSGEVAQIQFIYIGTGAYLPNSLVDNSGNGNHGTIYGATPVPSISGKALAFDGVNDRVAIPYLMSGSNFTIHCVVKLSSTGLAQYIFIFNTNKGAVQLFINGTNNIVYATRTAAGNYLPFISTQAVAIGVDCYLTFTSDNGVAKAYLNSVLIGTLTGCMIDFTGITSFMASQTASAGWFSGTIDEPRIYNRALSAQEVYDLYQRGLKASVDNTTAWYKMDSVPEIPNDPAGVTYLQDAWATVDGWTIGSGTGSLSVSGGLLVLTPSASPAALRIDKAKDHNGKDFRVKIKSGSELGNIQYYNGTTYVNMTKTVVGDWIIATAPATIGLTNITYIRITSVSVLTNPIYFDWIYIGTGAYLPNSLVDNSGNGNHGTIYGATPDGKALAFDGVNDYCAIPNPQATAYTLHAQYKRVGTGLTQTILYTNRSVVGGKLILRIGTDNKINALCVDSALATQQIIGPVTTTDVESATLVHTGTAMSLYINGALYQTITSTLTSEHYNLVRIGVSGTTFAQYMYGTIRSPRIYNRALSADEVKFLYDNPTLEVDSISNTNLYLANTIFDEFFNSAPRVVAARIS